MINSNATRKRAIGIITGGRVDALEGAGLVVVERDGIEALEAENERLRTALEGLVGLMESDNPVEIGCHCTHSGDAPIVCVWCKARKALEAREQWNG
jgi:hypothetical protein